MKTTELIGPALDWLVAKCEGHIRSDGGTYAGEWQGRVGYAPSTNWSQGGPIIERERISVEPFKNTGKWSAFKFDTGDCEISAPTPLIAAMRCYIASRIGDEVEIPEGV